MDITRSDQHMYILDGPDVLPLASVKQVGKIISLVLKPVVSISKDPMLQLWDEESIRSLIHYMNITPESTETLKGCGRSKAVRRSAAPRIEGFVQHLQECL